MFRRPRSLILIVLAAGIGALAGRWVAEARGRLATGDDPLEIDLHDLHVRPQDVVPGVMAGFRVGEPPWSWFHVPGWLVAFGMNFVAAAAGGDLDRLRQMAEERALQALGLEPEPQMNVQDVPPPTTTAPPAEPHAAGPQPTEPRAAEAPFTPREPAPPSPTDATARSASTSGVSSAPTGEQQVWTSENATPSEAQGHGAVRGWETPGFTPLRD